MLLHISLEQGKFEQGEPMRMVWLWAALASVAVIFTMSQARAATFSYTCTNTLGELQLRLSGISAWTSPASTHTVVSGDIVEINSNGASTPCKGDIFVTTNGVIFANNNNSGSAATNDIIDGMFEVSGAHITINGLDLTCSACSSSMSNTTGLSTFTEAAALTLHDGAIATLENSTVDSSQTSGIYETRSSGISIISTTINGNGTGSAGVPFTSGIYAEDSSSVRLGKPNGTGGPTITANGLTTGNGCPGFGIILEQGSSMSSFNATIGGTGSNQNTCGQLFLETGSSARLEATTITQTTAQAQAITAQGGSSVIAERNSSSNGVLNVSSGGSSALLLIGASSGMLNSATLSSTNNNEATVQASASSTITLASGNTVSNTSGAGVAFQIDHSSSFLHAQGSRFGYTNAADTVAGDGAVQEQSSMDLGEGLYSAVPSINWTTNTSNGINVQQNSSFRLSGGVSITGNIIIQQGSNGFLNTANGGTNVITSGTMSCPFTTVAASHVSAPTKVTPNVVEATSYASATSPQCLPF